MSSLAGKVAIITGSSSGIGAATAVHFAKLGCSLVITGRNEENLNKTKAECVAAGLADNQVVSVVADISAPDGPGKIAKAAEDHFGRLDVLVNNAGIGGLSKASDCPIEEFEKIFNTNVKAVIILTQKCLPLLVKAKGSVVNISSGAGIVAVPANAYYCMSKAALNHYTRCLALELASVGVRVNTVSPGAIDTPIFGRFGMPPEQVSQMVKMMERFHPLGHRIGQPDEVAKAIAFLASNDSSFTTGENIRVDGASSQLSAIAAGADAFLESTGLGVSDLLADTS